MLFNAAYNMQV